MKKKLLYLIFLWAFMPVAYAADLLEVYEQSIVSDPTYQQSIAQALATIQGVPISLSSLLPNIGMTAAPSLTQVSSSGPGASYIGNDRKRGYTIDLTATQTLFNFAQFANWAQAKSTAKQAQATLNAAAQDLMVRVAKAYFQILEDEDILRASGSTKLAYSKQLDQVTQQYKVGIKTITDVYTAQASYEASVADYIATETALTNDRENLRVITGKLYTSLSKLSEKFPLISPIPTNIDIWVTTSIQQNWQVKAAQYGLQAARQNIRQQEAGHLPTLNIQGSYDINFSHDLGGSTTDIINPPGAGQTHTSAVALNFALPLYQGGLVVAETHQAEANFQVAAQQLELQLRNAQNQTRQSYLGVIAGISQIHADKKAIQSSISSLEGMEEGYRVGTEILVNVLNQQEQVFNNQKQYAHDRYAYVNNLLALKQAAGTLSPDDLAAINAWLSLQEHRYTPRGIEHKIKDH